MTRIDACLYPNLQSLALGVNAPLLPGLAEKLQELKKGKGKAPVEVEDEDDDDDDDEVRGRSVLVFWMDVMLLECLRVSKYLLVG